MLRLRPVAPPPPRPAMPTVIEPTDPSLHLQSSTRAALASPAAQFPHEMRNVGARMYARTGPPPPPRMDAFDAGASRFSAKERKQQDLLHHAQRWSPSSSSHLMRPANAPAGLFLPAAPSATVTSGHAAFPGRYL